MTDNATTPTNSPPNSSSVVASSDSVKARLREAMTAAMKAQDAARTSTLRMAKAALMNKQIEKGRALDDAEALQQALGGVIAAHLIAAEQGE